MNRPYHYTECGLDSVYLVNGYELVGQNVRIHDIDGLHDMIGQWLVTTRKKLSGREFRFLRHELEMSQATLARLFGMSEQAVARWEKDGEGHSNPAADRALRLLYLEKISGNADIEQSLSLIADIEDELDRTVEFCLDEPDGWQLDDGEPRPDAA